LKFLLVMFPVSLVRKLGYKVRKPLIRREMSNEYK